jgi:hypothetical protein
MNIINKFISVLKNLDNKIKKIMNKGLIVSFLLCIISAIILFTYQFIYKNPDLYYIGISLFKSSLMFGCVFVMCAIGFDTIKNELA